MNDNAPSFAQSTYTITVDQYDAAGSLMGTVAPTDPDSGVNGEFSCSGSSTATSATTYYSIGADCGQCSVHDQQFYRINFALLHLLTFCHWLFLRFRGVSFVLSIRELGVWDDLEVHHHGGGQGLAGADGHHLRRRHLQGDHHHHNHHHSGALYLQLLGRQRCRGGFLDRHCSRSGLTQRAGSGATHTQK